MMPAFKSTQVAYLIAAHIYLSLSMMMMSTFMVCDSINLNAQCNGMENRKLKKHRKTHTHTKTWFSHSDNRCVFRRLHNSQGVCFPHCLWSLGHSRVWEQTWKRLRKAKFTDDDDDEVMLNVLRCQLTY